MERLRVRRLAFSADTEVITNENKQVYKETYNEPHDNGV